MPYLYEAPMIWFQRFYTGWVTLRNQLVSPIRLMGRRVIELLDALLAGNDLEITPRLTLQRRPGYLFYGSGATGPLQMNGRLLNTYSWKTATQGVFQIFDTTVDVEYIPPNATAPTAIFTKPAGSIGSKAYMFGVGNYLFVSGNGFAFKWDGPTGQQGVTNWGISAATTSTGPDTAGAGASQASSYVAWSNPSDVTGSGPFSTVVLSPAAPQSQSLFCQTFGFTTGTVPAASKINSATITCVAGYSGTGTSTLGAILLINGVPVIPAVRVSGLPLVPGTITFTIFKNIPPAQAVLSNFGVSLAASTTGSGTFSVNNVNITLNFNTAPTVSTTGSGTFTAVNGYSYVQAYGNSFSGEISNASQASTNTGPFTNQNHAVIAVTASADTQVNEIHLYRTTDSGGGSIFYELPNSPFPNTSTNVNDSAADTALQIANQAATNLQNSPPPANMTAMEWFAGRLWGAVGNQLYFSTGPDSLIGLQQSNWNPAYVVVMPTSITRNVALPNGMLIHTLDEIQVARGTSTTAFTFTTFIRDIGTWNYNAVDTDGSNVYVFTADRQFVGITASGVEEVGGGVTADQLQNVDPTQAYVTIYRSGLDSMLFLLDTPNSILYPFNTRQNAWCLPAILQMNNTTAAGAMEVQPGIWKYLMGSSKSIAQRDLNTFTDLGNTYIPQAIVGTIQEADPGTLAKVENLFLELTNAGSVPTVSVLPNDQGVTLTNPVGTQITGKFIQLVNPQPDPPTYGATPVNYRSLRFNWLTSPAAEQVKYVQILLQWPAEAAQNEVLGLGLSGKQQGDSPAQGQLPQLQGH